MKRPIKSSSLMTKWHAIIAAAEDPRLSGLALRVYIRLVDHFNLKRGQCNPSIHRLAKALQVTPRGVQKALRCLEGLELIITDCGGGCHRSNRYHIPAIKTPNSRVITCSASARRPFATRKRGLSGMTSKVTRNNKAGAACTQNIQRHAG